MQDICGLGPLRLLHLNSPRQLIICCLLDLLLISLVLYLAIRGIRKRRIRWGLLALLLTVVLFPVLFLSTLGIGDSFVSSTDDPSDYSEFRPRVRSQPSWSEFFPEVRDSAQVQQFHYAYYYCGLDTRFQAQAAIYWPDAQAFSEECQRLEGLGGTAADGWINVDSGSYAPGAYSIDADARSISYRQSNDELEEATPKGA